METILQEPKYKSMSSNELTEIFQNCCASGDIEKISYLLTSPETKNKINIHSNSDQAFTDACEYGNFNVVQYLLDSNEIKDHIDINTNKSSVVNAARGNHVDILKYLQTKIQDDKDLIGYAFIGAAAGGAKDVIKYLIFDYKIERTEEIDDSIKELDKTSHKIDCMFKDRDNKWNVNLEKFNKLKEEINQ